MTVPGGSYLASELARTISERKLGSTPQNGFPASCIISDSCPGCVDVGAAVRGFTAAIKSRILKVVASLLFYLGLFVLIIMRVLLRQEHLIHAMRARLNEASVFPWMSSTTPRLYIYSDADDMVPASAVEEHIADAKQKGRIVHVEKYHGSLHVTHADMDPERYWCAVQSLWSEAVKLSKENN
ncbi:hypothetical protein EIP86_005253 [Pleurotus ostreatoroseus]|nr:hypothetical protein EIP86_005253 [Pleurotus ostreatoroseus]